MICIHHNKDLDGFSSGAIVKLKYPDAKLIGWDYKDPIPDFEQFKGEEVIMIDISFPLEKLLHLGTLCNLTVIDHHISFYKEVDNWLNHNYSEIQTHDLRLLSFKYIYELGVAACEIGWKYLFPEKEIPKAITLLGRYDTWRQNEGDWEGETLPFQYWTRLECTSPETFPDFLFWEIADLKEQVEIGSYIIDYQEQQDMLACQRSSFERDFNGLRAICLNTRAFSSNTMKTVYDNEKHDIMVGFEYTGTKWSISLRSIGDKADCSIIAKERGGGGHKNAAGFECNTFDEIFK